MMLSGMAARAGRAGLLALTATVIGVGLYTGAIQAAFAADAHPAARLAAAAAGWLTLTLLFWDMGDGSGDNAEMSVIMLTVSVGFCIVWWAAGAGSSCGC